MISAGIIVCISRLMWAIALFLALALLPTILIAELAPANTAAKQQHTKRHTGRAPCRHTGQRCSTGCGTFSDKGVCAEYVCDHRAWNFSGFASNLSARPNLVERDLVSIRARSS